MYFLHLAESEKAVESWTGWFATDKDGNIDRAFVELDPPFTSSANWVWVSLPCPLPMLQKPCVAKAHRVLGPQVQPS